MNGLGCRIFFGIGLEENGEVGVGFCYGGVVGEDGEVKRHFGSFEE